MFEEYKDKSFIFFTNWIDICDDLELKLLILFNSCGKNGINGKKYTGNLADMSKWLGIKPNNYSNKKLRAAIESLNTKNLISYELSGRQYKVEVCGSSAENIFYFRYCWLDEIRQFNRDKDGNKIDPKICIDWSKLVKVFVYCFLNVKSDYIYKQDELAAELNISSGTLGIVLKALQKIYFESLMFEKKTKKSFDEYTKAYRNLGTVFELGYDFTNIR